MTSDNEVQDLFDEWYDAERSVIGEFSSSIMVDCAELDVRARARAERLGLTFGGEGG